MAIFDTIFGAISNFIVWLDSYYVFPGVSLLGIVTGLFFVFLLISFFSPWSDYDDDN